MPRARRRAALTLRESVGSVAESLEGRCLLTGAAASAAVPWSGDTAGTTTSSSSGYMPADVSIYAGAPGYEEEQQAGWFRVHREYGFSCGSGCGCGGGIDSSLTVYYEFDPDNSTATQTDDFYPLDGYVTFQSGESDAYVEYMVNDDHVVEDTESLRLNLVPGGDYDIDPSYGYATNYIYDNEPTVSISAQDTADEQGATIGKFTITRTTEMYAELDVDLLIGGTASPGTDYTLTDADTGEPIAGSVTIPSGEYSTDVIVTPVDDTTPEWTETVTATLAPGDPPAFRLGQTSATVEITDNDLGLSIQAATTGPDGNPVINLNNDDDDGDGIADLEDSSASGGGDDDLAPLSVDYPQDIKYGATVTLSGDTSKLKVWADASKSQLVLGDDQTSHTWIVGQDSIPSQMVVEGVAGSEELADASLTLRDSDSPATPPPTRPTSNQTTRPVTIRFIHIFWTDPLHPDDGFKDRAGIGVNGNGQPLKVIVGEGITLAAQAGPPEMFPPNAQKNWDVPGNNVGGYGPGAHQAQPTPTVTTDQFISFYWVDEGNRRVVTYTTNGWQQKVAFDIVRPIAHVTALTPQLPSIFPQANADGSTSVWVKFDPGIKFSNQNPQIPNGFAGTFSWVQLVEPHDTFWTTADGVAHNFTTTSPDLDKSYPYSNDQAGTGDGPMAIDVKNTWVNHVVMDDDLTMYLMFTPTQLNGQPLRNGAIPVPLRKVDWWWTGEAQWNGQQWVGSHLDASMNPSDINTRILPVWDENASLDVHFNPALPPKP